MHAYEKIPLNTAGFVLAAFIIGLHLWMVLQSTAAIDFFKKFPRNTALGRVLMTIGLAWFWLLVIDYGGLEMELNDFNGLKPILLFVVPIVGFFIIKDVKEFLAVRGLGVVMLMAAAPLLAAAWQKPNEFQILIPLYAYAMIIKGLFCVGMPYYLRDTINWATATPSRFRFLSLAGLAYGLAVLSCALMFWGA